MGLNVTINTDDPSISQITLGEEYQLVCQDLGLPINILRERVLAAVSASFLPEGEKVELLNTIERHWPVVFVEKFSISRSKQDDSEHPVTMNLTVFVKKKQET